MGVQSVGNIIKENILIGPNSISAPDNPHMEVTGNIIIDDEQIHTQLQTAYPRLTDPCVLPELPVFKLLESGKCAQTLTKKGAAALFGKASDNKKTKKPTIKKSDYNLMPLDLTAVDYEGCDMEGDVTIQFDSIKPGTATKVNSEGAYIQSAIPWVMPKKKYSVVASLRFSSPYTKGVVYVTGANGYYSETTVSGDVAKYNEYVVQFTGDSDVLFQAGVKTISDGYIFVESIDVYEI